MRKYFFICLFLTFCSLIIVGFSTMPDQKSVTALVGTPTPFDSKSFTVDVPGQLSYGWIDSGNFQVAGATFECENLLKSYPNDAPVLMQTERTKNTPFGSLCLKGFPPNQPFTIDIKYDDGHLFKSLSLETSGKDPQGEIYYFRQRNMNSKSPNVGYSYQTGLDNRNWIAEIVLYLPVDSQPVNWKVTARSGNLIAEGSLDTAWPKGFPAIFVPESKFEPLYRTKYLMPQDNPIHEVAGGATIAIEGVNLPANKSLPLALFAPDTTIPLRLNLLRYSQITTDSRGRFRASFNALPDERIESYYLVAVTNPSGKVPGISYLDGAGPYLGIHISSYDPCLNLQISSSFIGRSVKINPGLGLPLNIRQDPGKNSPSIGFFQVGAKATIDEGPRCVDNMAWWRISLNRSDTNEINKLRGWVADGNGTQRWLVDYIDQK